MANFFNVTLGTDIADLRLKLAPRNKSDSYIYFDVVPSGTTIPFNINPTEEVRIMIAPHSASVSDLQASGYLTRTNRSTNLNSGFYFTTIINNTDETDQLIVNPIKIEDRTWENTSFDLFWIQKLDVYQSFGSNTSGVYSYPGNLRPENVVISGYMVNQNQITYNVKWGTIANSNDVVYSGVPHGYPYQIEVKYSANGVYASGFTDWQSHASGIMSSGISFGLPFYNDQISGSKIPAIYTFSLANMGPTLLQSDIAKIEINHQKLIGTDYLGNLDNQTFTNPNRDQIKLIDDITIDNPYIIDRRRLSLGIDDIAIKENSYQKQGTYISNQYALDFEMYTFSLKVQEIIPTYPNIMSYDVIKYYVEFNANQWEPISPITRNDELIDGVLVPKLFIFDAAPETDVENSSIKYIDYGSTINNFRVKIVFDLSKLTNNQFAPPEVHDYKCLVFDKNQFFNL